MKSQTGLGIQVSGAYRQVRFHPELHTTARGQAVIQVMNRDGSVANALAARNLILNQGLNNVATGTWCDQFLYCAAGSGNTPTADDSGVTTAAQSGTAVTLTGGSFTFTDTATDAGKVIKWDSGATARVVTVTTPTAVVVANSATVANGQFTVHRANQVGLTTEIVRTGNLVSGSCSTAVLDGVVSYTRTYDFPVESGGVTYREVGFSGNSGAGNNLFSRIKLAQDLPLVATQNLRVIYTLQLTLSPVLPQSVTAPITGWPIAPATTTAGTQQIQYYGLSKVHTDGTTTVMDNGQLANEPSASTEIGISISDSTDALATVGSSVDRTAASSVNKLVSLSNYTALSFRRDKFTVFDIGEANGTGWRWVGIGPEDATYKADVDTTFGLLFQEAQTKDDMHTLELRFAYSWDRDLT